MCQKVCPCFLTPPEPEERLMPVRQLQTKIMVVGNIAVGKSTLIKCLVSGKSMRGIEVPMTIQFESDDNYTINLPEQNAKLTINFSDVTGSNSAPLLITQFVPMSNMIIVCYSTNNSKSFADLDDWLDHIMSNEQAKKLPKVLLATKKDLVDQRKIPTVHGEMKKREIDDCFYFNETSAYEDVEGVQTVFKDLANHILRNELYTELE